MTDYKVKKINEPVREKRIVTLHQFTDIFMNRRFGNRPVDKVYFKEWENRILTNKTGVMDQKSIDIFNDLKSKYTIDAWSAYREFQSRNDNDLTWRK